MPLELCVPGALKRITQVCLRTSYLHDSFKVLCLCVSELDCSMISPPALANIHKNNVALRNNLNNVGYKKLSMHIRWCRIALFHNHRLLELGYWTLANRSCNSIKNFEQVKVICIRQRGDEQPRSNGNIALNWDQVTTLLCLYCNKL